MSLPNLFTLPTINNQQSTSAMSAFKGWLLQLFTHELMHTTALWELACPAHSTSMLTDTPPSSERRPEQAR